MITIWEKHYQLQMSDVLFPPEVFLDARAETAQSIVGIHDHVHKRVNECTPHSYRVCGGVGYVIASHESIIVTLTLSASHPLYTDPPQEKHGGMVIDVQESDLLVLLSQNKEYLSRDTVVGESVH